MEIISRKEAKEQGLMFYYTGIPCKRGGTAQRRISNGCCQCFSCMNVKNKIDTKSYNKNYEKNKAKLQQYKDEHWEEYTQSRRNHYSKNKEMYSEIRRKYEGKNPEKVKEWARRRIDLKKSANVGWREELTSFVMTEARRLRKLRRDVTGFKWSIDHMIPYNNQNVCGLHVWNNLQVIPLSINTSKRNELVYTTQAEWWIDFNKFF